MRNDTAYTNFDNEEGGKMKKWVILLALVGMPVACGRQIEFCPDGQHILGIDQAGRITGCAEVTR